MARSNTLKLSNLEALDRQKISNSSSSTVLQTNFQPKVLLSVIIPTLDEFENLKFLIPQILQVLNNSNDFRNNFELIIVDDLSDAKTQKMIQSYNKNGNIKLFPSNKKRGLAKAALQGFKVANGIIVALMDGDGSHEPRQITKILEPILRGKANISVGSRYIEGGSTSQWSSHRLFISKLCATLARPLSGLHDSGSGFFAFRKDKIKLDQIKPSSWKLGLEICTKFPHKVIEVPIHFEDRKFGESKLTFTACLSFAKHLSKLYLYKLTPNSIHKNKKSSTP